MQVSEGPAGGGDPDEQRVPEAEGPLLGLPDGRRDPKHCDAGYRHQPRAGGGLL